jgi:hypothetical protein
MKVLPAAPSTAVGSAPDVAPVLVFEPHPDRSNKLISAAVAMAAAQACRGLYMSKSPLRRESVVLI